MNTDISRICVPATASLREVMICIDQSGLRMALIVDADRRLEGLITDGDIRRGLMSGLNLDVAASVLMNRNPITCRAGTDPDTLEEKMRAGGLLHIPLLDHEGRLVGLHLLGERQAARRRTNPVVIMAGGLGARLAHLTVDTPKPMLKVGDRPLLEHLVVSLAAQGFYDLHLSVNYKAEFIERHFGDGSGWNVQITYVHEPARLGTAGALGLLPRQPVEPVLVLNGDLLTKLSFAEMLDFHISQNVDATMAVREYQIQVPYGVVSMDGQRIINVREKPTYSHYVSAGVYVLEPPVLGLVPKNAPFDMPELFQSLLASSRPTAAFPVEGYWLDIGHIADYERANGEFASAFS